VPSLQVLETGEGRSRRIAEQDAAHKVLARLQAEDAAQQRPPRG
jgi:dsRNA-specific ribonuclease